MDLHFSVRGNIKKYKYKACKMLNSNDENGERGI